MEPKKYDYIDALRGWAVLAVLLVHCALYGSHPPTHPAFAAVVQQGARGVQLFYVLSALTLYLSMHNRSGQERRPTLNFFLRRFFRIAPLFYGAMLYFLWQDGWGPRYWLGTQPGISPAQLLATATFTNGWNPRWMNSLVPGGWSIAVEMTFYLLLPLLFAAVTTLRRAAWLAGLTTLAAVGCYALLMRYPLIPETALWTNYVFLSFPIQLPIFALGIVLYFLLRPDAAAPAATRAGLLLLTAGVLMARLTLGQLVPNYLCFGVCFVLLTYALAHYPFRALVNPFTRYVGQISYSMYLTHQAVLHLLHTLHLTDLLPGTGEAAGLANYALRYALLLALDLGVATATYRLIEQPGMRLGQRLIRWLEREPAPLAAPVPG